ncbi:hypothetical protein KJ596_02655 [Patescibacteria group bacterium]|nr:hypothetical protein [Patescibacteria group bacterium]MBU1868692.1 hypothetical protein [Patescibacteria group bacterium]
MAVSVLFSTVGHLDEGLLGAVEIKLYSWGVPFGPEMDKAMRIVREHVATCKLVVTVHVGGEVPQSQYDQVSSITDRVTVYHMLGGDLWFVSLACDEAFLPED